MADNEDAKFVAHAKHDEATFIIRMVGVKESQGVLIKKYGLGFFKRDAMFFDILPVLLFIPLETQLLHMYSICTLYISS